MIVWFPAASSMLATAKAVTSVAVEHHEQCGEFLCMCTLHLNDEHLCYACRERVHFTNTLGTVLVVACFRPPYVSLTIEGISQPCQLLIHPPRGTIEYSYLAFAPLPFVRGISGADLGASSLFGNATYLLPNGSLGDIIFPKDVPCLGPCVYVAESRLEPRRLMTRRLHRFPRIQCLS